MTEQEKRFRRVCKKCCRPRYIGDACCKFSAQYLRVTGLDMLLDAENRREIRKVPRPRGWRKNIFMRLRKTVFKDLNKDHVMGRSIYYVLGKAVGIAFNVNYALEDENKTPADRKLFKKAFGVTPHEMPKANKPKTLNLKLTPSQLSEYSEGMRDGSKALFTDTLEMAHARTPTGIQLCLLVFSEIVRHAENIYTLWQFFKDHNLDEFKHSPESLEKICRRVGIPLALKSASRKKPGQSKSRVSGQ